MKKQLLPMEELVKLLRVQLNNGGRADLVVTGVSMYPMLRNRRDRVTLIPAPELCKKADIILYRRQSGQYVLHRIVRVKDGGYICCGDNQAEIEPVDHSQVIAVVDGFTRKGKAYSLDHRGYRMYLFFWVELFPLRQVYIRLRHALGRLRRKLLKKEKNISGGTNHE